MIASPWAHFEWSSGNTEIFVEENWDGFWNIYIKDQNQDFEGGDQIFTVQDGGATHPDRTLDLEDLDSNDSNNAFTDVEITLLN